ncbi:MAG: hypothetical protein U0Q18_23755 [Bryobacteraceae bacterium]
MPGRSPSALLASLRTGAVWTTGSLPSAPEMEERGQIVERFVAVWNELYDSKLWWLCNDQPEQSGQPQETVHAADMKAAADP